MTPDPIDPDETEYILTLPYADCCALIRGEVPHHLQVLCISAVKGLIHDTPAEAVENMRRKRAARKGKAA